MAAPGVHTDDWNPLTRVDRAMADFLRINNLESMYLLLNAISDGVVCVDREARVVYANHAARRILGYSRQELAGQDFMPVSNGAAAAWESALRDGDIVASNEQEFLHKNGASVHVSLTAIPIQQGDEITGAALVFRDITPAVLLNLSVREREELLKGIFEIVPTGMLLMNSEGRIIRMNDEARGCLGLSDLDGDLNGRPLPAELWRVQDAGGQAGRYEDAPFNQLRRARADWRAARDAGDEEGEREALDRLDAGFESILLCEGSDRYTVVRSATIHSSPDAEPFLMTTFTDIDRQFRTQRRLSTAIRLNHEVNQLLTSLLTERGAVRTIDRALSGVAELLRANLAAIAVYDSGRNSFVFQHFYGVRSEAFRVFEVRADASPYAYRYQNTAPLAIPDYPRHPLAHPDFVEAGAQHALMAPILSESQLLGAIYLFRTEDGVAFDGEDRANIETLAPVVSAAVYKAGYEEKLNELASTDSLTGLFNRREFFRFLEHEVARSRRYESRFTVVMLDLDRFKQINDVYGHLVGDEALVEAARVMKRCMRECDVVARTGGEEFMALLPQTDLQGGLDTAEKIRAALEEVELHSGEDRVHVTASLGVAEHEPAEDMNDFYARLDSLLYRSKKKGRNCVSG